MQPSQTPSDPPSSAFLAALDHQAQRVSERIAQHPAAGIAACFGAGYLAGKLPLFRFLTGTIRIALPLLPPVLAAVGAARVWGLVSPPELRTGAATREEGEALNQLLAIALASRESYGRAAPRFDGEDRRLIEHLRSVHEEGVRHLKKAVQDSGVFPLLGNSPWDGLVEQLGHVTGGRLADSSLFGLMLSAEESAVRMFESALLDPSFGEEQKTLIRQHLLPRAEENVNSLLRQRSQQQPQLATVTP